MDIVRFDPLLHQHHWEDFIVATYRNPNYVMLSPAFLRWQFLDNPANLTGGYTLWLITRREQIVAQVGFVPFLGVSPKGQSFYGAYPINLMVRPDYRAAGLGAVLLGRLLREFPCLVNPGVNEAGAVLGKGLGMTDLGFLRRYIAIIDKRAARVLALNGRLPEGIKEANVSEEAESGVRHVMQMPPEAPAHFPFPQPAYGVVRTRDFLCWRYEQHPAFAYEFLFSLDYRSILVFHEERDKSSGVLILRVLDVLAQPEHQLSLFRSVVLIAKLRGAAVIDFFCSLSCYATALEGAGFFDEAEHSDGRIAALFQPLDFRKTGILVLASCPNWGNGALSDWYITKADSDQDRPNDKNAIELSAHAEIPR